MVSGNNVPSEEIESIVSEMKSNNNESMKKETKNLLPYDKLSPEYPSYKLNSNNLSNYSNTIISDPKCNIYKDAVKKLNYTGYISNDNIYQSWNDTFSTVCGNL